MTSDSQSNNAGEAQKSKSQRKREVNQLQTLGEQLLDLTPRQLAALPLTEKLQAAIAEYARLRANGAKRRQRQYIGALMRDADVAGIEDGVRRLTQERRHEADTFRQVEQWRDSLVQSASPQLEALLNRFTWLDQQMLRQLVANARRVDAEPGAMRKLFRFLMAAASSAPSVERDRLLDDT